MNPIPQKKVKPRLRGVSHQIAFFVAIAAGGMLVGQASDIQTRWAALVYSISLAAMFGISALYHRPNWKPEARAWMRRLDHAAIFILVAGSATPVSLFVLQNPFALKMMWVGAALGIGQSLFWAHAPKPVSAAIYAVFGLSFVPYIPDLLRGVGWGGLALLAGGGIVYLVGAAIYALRKPDPIPEVFGYHEVFHLLVIVAALLHFIAIYQIVL